MNQLICFVLSQISYVCPFISRGPRLCMKSFLISHVAIHTLSQDWSDRAGRKRSADRNVWTTLLSAFVPNISGVHEEMNYCKCCNKHTVVCIWTDFTYHRVDKCWQYGTFVREHLYVNKWTFNVSLLGVSLCALICCYTSFSGFRLSAILFIYTTGICSNLASGALNPINFTASVGRYISKQWLWYVWQLSHMSWSNVSSTKFKISQSENIKIKLLESESTQY